MPRTTRWIIAVSSAAGKHKRCSSRGLIPLGVGHLSGGAMSALAWGHGRSSFEDLAALQSGPTRWSLPRAPPVRDHSRGRDHGPPPARGRRRGIAHPRGWAGDGVYSMRRPLKPPSGGPSGKVVPRPRRGRRAVRFSARAEPFGSLRRFGSQEEAEHPGRRRPAGRARSPPCRGPCPVGTDGGGWSPTDRQGDLVGGPVGQ